MTPQTTLFFSGDAYFQSLRQHIRQAKEEVLFECYLVNMDPVGVSFLDELASAVQRGVRVRLLVDGVGSFNWLNSILKHCKSKNIAVRVYHPLPLQFMLTQKLSWKNIRRLLFLFRHVNRRNHRKVLIVDRQIVMLGSFNLSQVHSEKMMGAQAWRDTGVLLQFNADAPEVLAVRYSFSRSWRKIPLFTPLQQKKYRSKSVRSQTLFRLNDSFRKRRALFGNLKKRLRHAKRRILITTPYFLPSYSQYARLLSAARNGVYVGLLVPAINDVRVVQLASRVLYQKLLDAGVHIYEYAPRVLHAKTLIIDNWATVGSANFNHRSWIHDLEVDVEIRKSENIEELVQHWDLDVTQANRISRSQLSLRWWENFLGQIIYLFRYWL